MRITTTSRTAATVSAAAIVLMASAAAPVRAESLADAISLAYQSNPQIQATRAQLRALNETYVQARAGFGPRVSAEVDLNYQEVREHAAALDKTVHFEGRTSGETVNLSQPIFSGGRVAATVQAAEADVRAGRARLRQSESDLLVRVVAAYVAVRRDQQILDVSNGTVRVLEQQLEETQAKTDVRENTRTDLAQAQARLAAAQSQLASAEATLAASRATYLSQVGQNPGDLAPEPEVNLIPASIEQAFDRAESDNPTLLAAKYAEQGSRARVSLARAQDMPNLSLRVQSGRAPNNLAAAAQGYANQVTAQAVITQPLFTSGLNSSQIRRALELNTADRLGIETARRTAVQTVSQTWSQLAAARKSLIADQNNVAASEMAFYGMRQEERQGLRSTIELLNTQQELTSAQIGMLRDRYNEYVSRISLLSAMGALTVEVLAPGVQSYDPLPDFNRVKNKGALPIEFISKTLDSAAVADIGPPRAAREVATPDRQLPMPAQPGAAALQRPLMPVTQLMDETRTPPPEAR